MSEMKLSDNCGGKCREAMDRMGAFSEEVKALAAKYKVQNVILLAGEKIDEPDHRHMPSITAINADLGMALALLEVLRDSLGNIAARTFMEHLAPRAANHEPSAN